MSVSRVEWVGHNVLHRELVFELTIVNSEPLRIGAGESSDPASPVDLPVLKVFIDNEERPFIPGSSLKGVFRSFMDTLIRSSGGYTCPGVGNNVCYSLSRIKNEIKQYVTKGDYDSVLNILWNNLCLSCKVYGSASYRSKVLFQDFMPQGDVKLGIKPGIAIDRRTGTAAKRALYQVEFVQPGARFKGSIIAKDVPNYVLGIIGLTLIEINEGRIKLGGFKTRGFGRVRISDLNISIYFNTERSGGILGENRIRLAPMDPYDREVVVEADYKVEEGAISSIVIGSNEAWKLLTCIVTETIADREYLKQIAKTHYPLWMREV